MNSQIVIFTDEPGWHGRALRQWFVGQGYGAAFVSLTDCRVDFAANPNGMVIPGFEQQLPVAAFVRGVPGGSLEQIVLRLNFLHLLEAAGCVVFNSARIVERTVDKSYTSLMLKQQRIPTPQTFVSESPDAVHDFLSTASNSCSDWVKKPLFGSQGKGLRRINAENPLGPLLPGEVAYLQEFIAPSGARYRDWRVMVVDGIAIAAMERSSEHWVTNRAQGATCKAVMISSELGELAVAAANAVGADYAGVDLLRNHDGQWLVTEVNGIPAWQGLQRVSKIDITARLGQALLGRLSHSLAKPA